MSVAQPSATEYAIQINQYYLSVYPCQTNPPAASPVLAYMTLLGEIPVDDGVDATDYTKATFYINFYADGTQGLSAPGVNRDSSGDFRVVLDMYYCQLAGMLDIVNKALQPKGHPCFIGYTDGPPPHAEFGIAVSSKTAQSITFNAPPATALIPTTVPKLDATSDSGLTVQFESKSPDICTVSGSNVTLLSKGACIIKATQPGSANYQRATPVIRRFDVT